jgi:urease beta subunit
MSRRAGRVQPGGYESQLCGVKKGFRGLAKRRFRSYAHNILSAVCCGASVIPGEYILAASPVTANANRRTVELEVANTGDRPIQVGSHFHFFEVNKALRFDRAEAFGMRLNIPAGTAVRFEPGDTKRISLVELGGSATVYGLNALTNGPANGATRPTALEQAKTEGFERA